MRPQRLRRRSKSLLLHQSRKPLSLRPLSLLLLWRKPLSLLPLWRKPLSRLRWPLRIITLLMTAQLMMWECKQ
jgi:hypothetical protein